MNKQIYFWIKHVLLLGIGLGLMSMAVALAKIALLGTSPISSVPNVVSELTPLTIGEVTILFMLVIVALEAVVLRRYFGWMNLLQLLPSLAFGTMIDWFVRFFGFIQPTHYWQQMLLTILSIFVLAAGVFFEVNSRVIMMPGEGIAAAMAFRWRRPFAVMKVRADFGMVIAAVVVSLVFGHQLIGVREGTLLSALIAGRIEGLYEALLPRLRNWVRDEQQEQVDVVVSTDVADTDDVTADGDSQDSRG